MIDPTETEIFIADIVHSTAEKPAPASKPSGAKVLLAFAGICTIGLGALVALGSQLAKNKWRNREELKETFREAMLEERSKG